MNRFASFSSSSTLSSRIPKRACIVSRCNDQGYFFYNIYIAELKSESRGFGLMSPTLRLDYRSFGDMAFCALGSVLYMFEGIQNSTAALPPPDGKTITRSVYCCDLSSIDLTQSKIKLGKSSPMLVKVCSWHPKTAPAAIPTPDPTKFLVFSSFILHDSDFELFDTSNASWFTLPRICDPKASSFWVKSYTFTDKSVLFIETTIGMFQLDFESLENGWERQLSYYENKSTPVTGGLFYAIDNILCLTPDGFCDVSGRDGFLRLFRSPVSSFDGYDFVKHYRHTVSFVTLIDYDMEEGLLDYAVLRVWKHMDWRNGVQPRMIVDVFKSDLNKYREDMSAESLATTEKVMSVKIFDQRYSNFTPYAVYVF